MAQSRKASEAADPGDEEGAADLRGSAVPGEGLTVEAGRPFAGAKDKQQRVAGDEELPAPPPPPLEIELVDEATVRSGLQLQGSLVHSFVAVDPTDDEWVWLEHELDAIAPPLTRIINRYPALAAAAAAYGDPAVVLGSIVGYTTRSMQERAIAIARLEQEGPPTGQVDFEYRGG